MKIKVHPNMELAFRVLRKDLGLKTDQEALTMALLLAVAASAPCNEVFIRKDGYEQGIWEYMKEVYDKAVIAG